MDYELAVKNIRSELKNYLIKGNLKSLVLGISGGIDSTLCAALAKPVCDELNIPLIGRSLPCMTNTTEEIDRADSIGETFCTDFKVININEKFEDLSIFVNEDSVHPLSFERKIQNGNIKARIRMIYLYDLASVNKGLVLSTDNWTEYLLGFWTLHGDVGDYGMIQELWKTEVYEMTEWIANNEYSEKSIQREFLLDAIEAMATDGLGITNLGDLGQILPDWTGSSRDGYKEVDETLQVFTHIKEKALMTPKIIKAIDKMIKNPVIERHLNSGFKRNNPTNIKRGRIEDDGDPYDMSVTSKK